jgi:hypothetical protein
MREVSETENYFNTHWGEFPPSRQATSNSDQKVGSNQLSVGGPTFAMVQCPTMSNMDHIGPEPPHHTAMFAL